MKTALALAFTALLGAALMVAAYDLFRSFTVLDIGRPV